MANGFANGEYPNMPGWPSGYPPLGAGSMVRVYFYNICNLSDDKTLFGH